VNVSAVEVVSWPASRKISASSRDLLGVHRGAAVWIDGAEQPREEIVAVGAGPLAVRDQLVDDPVEGRPGARRPAVGRGRPGGWHGQRRGGAAEGLPGQHREGRVEDFAGLADVVAEDRPPHHPQRQADHLGARVDTIAGAAGALPASGDRGCLLGHERGVARDLLSGKQRLDQPSLPLPQLALARKQPPAEGFRDLTVEAGALRIALTRTGQNGPHALGVEHAVQVEPHAGRPDGQAHDVAALAHHLLVRVDSTPAQVER
jgi:hypothetical protein